MDVVAIEEESGKQYQDRLCRRIREKFYHIDWQWEGDDEFDERRLYPTLDFDVDRRDKKREFLHKMICAEGYGQ